MSENEKAREAVRDALKAYFQATQKPEPFVAGKTYIPASAKVLDVADLLALGEAAMDLWLTAGRFSREFERRIAQRFGRPHALFVNSGSSANLLAVSSLKLKPGDEVITAAAGFPTTVNPIVQNGLKPVLIDVELGTYNATVEQIEAAISPRTRAIALAHTLGNPFRADLVAELAQKRGLRLIEDCCDAFGSTINGTHVGTFGELATLSFYPAHHMTTGEGGALIVRDAALKRAAEKLRDWGRDCWCEPGHDNTCKKRFGWQQGGLPLGYDHKYIYSDIGYNLKATDMQAAIGLSQLDKLDGFIAKRRENFRKLHAWLAASPIADRIELPRATPGTEPSWFGFPIRCLKGVARDKVVQALEAARVGTRLMFAGNITRQPAYANVDVRAVGPLTNSDIVMNDVFWVGIHPALDDTRLAYVAEHVIKSVQRSTSS